VGVDKTVIQYLQFTVSDDNVGTVAASTAMITATAKSTTAVRGPFGSLLMREPPLDGENAIRLR
jgi:hypothetical protein